jgi:hypothetical protein
MARSIAQTRADAGESRRESPQPTADVAAEAGASSDMFSTAERIRDGVLTIRKRGFDPATCEQIEALAGMILRASSLRDSTDRRIGKLRAALQYLEQRIDAMLETGEQATKTNVVAPAVQHPIAASSQPLVGTNTVSKSTATEAAALAATNLSSVPHPTVVVAELMQPAAAEPAHEATIEAPAGAIPMDVAASPSSPVLLTASDTEPADFLLEPLPPPLAARAASEREIAATDAAAQHTADRLSERDQALIAPGITATDAPGTPPWSGVMPEAERTPRSGASPVPTDSISPKRALASDPGAPAAAARVPSIAPTRTLVTPRPRPLPNDPLAALKAMSDEERLALFT